MVQQLTIADAMAENAGRPRMSEEEKRASRAVAHAKRKKPRSQAEKVIEYINRCGSITQKDANMLGIFRLAARVYDINNNPDPRMRGLHIIAEMDEELNQDGEMVKFARYRFG